MQRTLPVPHPLHVITMISNPRRYRTRYQLYELFRNHMSCSGVQLHTVEVAFGERPYELPEDCIRIRTPYEVWIKEAALNVALQRLPLDWKYVAWIDADVQFVRPDWAVETVHMLQHHPIVQPWSIAHDLGPHYENFKSYRSFGYSYQQFLSRYSDTPNKILAKPPAPKLGTTGDYYMDAAGGGKGLPQWHSGYAWAARRDAIDHLGGLIDFAIAGSGDRHMAMSLIGRAEDSMPDGLTAGYREMVLEWQYRAERHLRRNIGYVEGSINHMWHGKKRQRGYKDRWQILTRNQYDPHKDIKYDSHGVLQLVDRGDDRSRQLRDDLMHYFQQRNEDSIDMD